MLTTQGPGQGLFTLALRFDRRKQKLQYNLITVCEYLEDNMHGNIIPPFLNDLYLIQDCIIE